MILHNVAAQPGCSDFIVEIQQLPVVSFGNKLNITVHQIPHKPCHIEAVGGPADLKTKTDALHPAAEKHPHLPEIGRAHV